MAVFDGSQLFYFDIKTGVKKPRYELKDGEIDLLVGLGSAVPALDIARSLKRKNNFIDTNKLIFAFWSKFDQEGKFETERDILLLIDKDNMEGLQHPFDFYLSQIGFSYYCENLGLKALPYFEDALAINPSGIGSNGQSYNYSYALALCSKETAKNWSRAIEYLDRAMEITPDKPQPYAVKGACLHNLNNYNEAIACLNMALDKRNSALDNGEKAVVFETRAMCWNALGMKDKADKDSAEAARYAKL